MINLRSIQNLSIKNKIIVIILFVTFLMHSIGFVFISIWSINRIKSEIYSGLVLNTKLVANNCVVPLTFGDDKQATEALSQLKNIEFIETGCLYDMDGNVFAIYPDTLNTSNILDMQDQPDNVLIDAFFHVKERVFYKDKFYGTLVIKANSKPLKIAKRNIILTLVILSLVLDILSVILASKMQKYISSPVIKLKKHFDTVTQNQDFSLRVSKINNDEIGELYEEFNKFMGEIESRSKARDIVAASLKSSKEKLDLALEGGEIGVWEWDLNTDMTIWDERMEMMFGLRPGSFGQDYKSFKACLHPDDIAITEEAIRMALEEDAPYDIVFRARWKNADIRYITAKAIVTKNNKGISSKMTGVCIDVTSIKRAEQELNTLNQILNETGSLAKIGGWEYDVCNGKGSWTDEVARIHDLDPNDNINKDIGLSFYTVKSKAIIEKALEQAQNAHKPYDLDLQIISAKGNLKWVRTIGKPVVLNGNVIKMQGSFQDITERKKIEDEIRKLNEELEQKVAVRTKELETKNEELEKMNKLFVGRELRMIELKEKIKKLESKSD